MPLISTHAKVAVRMLSKRKGLSASRLTTVTLVVAAVTAVFTVANATFLRPLPYPHPDRLTRVYLQPPGTSDFASANPLSPLSFLRFRERVKTFERFEGQWVVERAVAGTGEPESLVISRVSAGFFAMLGAPIAGGRTFSEEEVVADAKVVVLSHGMWMRWFGGSPAAVGSTLLIDRQPHTVIGIVAPGFDSGFVTTEMWTPLNLRASERLAVTFVRTIGQLRPGQSIADAKRELDALFGDINAELPQALNGWEPKVKDLQEAQFGSAVPALYMLLVAVGALALIATANLSNLTLADIMHRRAEFVLRAALGGNRAGIAAPEMAQAVLLAVVGGAVGLSAASWLVPVILSLDPSNTFSAQQLSLDWRVGMCGFGIALLVMVVAILVPVLRLTGPRLAGELAAGARRATAGISATRVRNALVATQTAMTLVLLSVGAIVVATFLRSAEENPGFDPHNVITAQLRLTEQTYPDAAARSAFITGVLDRVRAVPGVVAAATTMNPFVAGLSFVTMHHVEDRPTADGQPHVAQFRRVSPSYFDALGVPLVQGRDFDSRDILGRQPVVIVSRGLAQRFWPGEDPIGRRIKRGATATVWSTVIGVAGDVLDVGLSRDAVDTVYAPVLQDNTALAPVALVVRTTVPPSTFVATLKRAVWEIDPRQALGNVVSMEQFLGSTLGPQRFRATLVGVCGVLGALLATIGIYGVTARSISERTREIAIRMALGESHRSVLWTVSADSVKSVMLGAGVGAAISLLARSGLTALLPELQGGILPFSAAIGVGLVAIGAAAAMLAARAAVTVPPLTALKAE